jgi:hypothetical protein
MLLSSLRILEPLLDRSSLHAVLGPSRRMPPPERLGREHQRKCTVDKFPDVHAQAMLIGPARSRRCFCGSLTNCLRAHLMNASVTITAQPGCPADRCRSFLATRLCSPHRLVSGTGLGRSRDEPACRAQVRLAGLPFTYTMSATAVFAIRFLRFTPTMPGDVTSLQGSAMLSA